jgi:NTP pyrophosphatase (non-canonical NTP hydrolase)
METPTSEPTLSPELQQNTQEVPQATQDNSLNKLAEFIGDVLQQLAQLQSLMAERIGEIEAVEARAAALEERCTDLEAFNKAIKLRLRQQREGI